MTTGAVIVLGALGLLACGGDGAGNTPEESFRACSKAIALQDYEALYDLMEPSKIEATRESWEKGDEAGRALQEEYAKELDRPVEEVRGRPFKEVYLETVAKTFEDGRKREPEKFERFMAALPDAEILDVTYNEDRTRARVKYKAADEEPTATFYLEDGLWWMRFEKR